MPSVARDPDFYLQHADYVRALARQVVFDRHLAEDVEQRVWLAALAQAPSEVRSPRAWLKALVRSFAIKAWRGEARRSQREEVVSRSRAPVPTPAEILEHESARKQLVEALLELDEPYRATLLLRFFEGLELPEIARRLDLPLETVRTHYKRGLARLREKLERRRGELGANLALALVRAWRLEPPSYAAVGAAALRSLFQGALFVSATHKVAIAVAAIVLFFAGLWTWRQAAVATPSAAGATRDVAELAPTARSNERVEIPTAERAATALAAESQLAPAAEKDSRYGSLLLHVIWADDKQPAPGVCMGLLQEHADDYYHDLIQVRSGADGNVRIERILAGEVRAHIDRGCTAMCRVEPGANSEATIEIPAGFQVTGVVLDVDGRPFAGADIYLQLWGGSYDGYVVARSREDGTFDIRALAPNGLAAISARAPDRAPTRQCAVIAGLGETVKMRMQFEGAGGQLVGRVFDAAGVAVANARVLVGTDELSLLAQSPEGSLTKPPASQCVLTSERGEFEARGIPLGPQPIQVRAKAFVVWRGEADVPASGAAHLDVRLDAGAVLEGLVRDRDGAPVEGAEIWYDGETIFGATMCQTRADGSYELRGVPAGEFDVAADGGDKGSAQARLFGVAGGRVRWDAVLATSGLVLRGRVVAPGRELKGWLVGTMTMVGAARGVGLSAETDDAGRFEINDCPEGAMQVSLYPPDVRGWPPIAVVDDVYPSREELVLEPDPTLERNVHLRGRIVDSGGRPLAQAVVRPCNPRIAGQPRVLTDGQGRFELGPYPQGDWTLHVQSGGWNSKSPTHTCVAGESWDFGEVRAEQGGTVVVELSGECSPRGAELDVRLSDETGWEEHLAVEGRVARSNPIAAGHYRLVVEREGCAKVEREIAVLAGEETRVQVASKAN